MPAISYARGALGDRVPGLMQVDPLSQSRERAFIEEQMGRTALDTARWELQAKKEAWEAQKKQADASGQLATQFLSLWGGTMTDLKSMFGAAGEGLKSVTQLLAGGEGKMPDEMKGYLGTIGDLQKMMTQQYESYRTEFAPAETEFLKGAREEMGARRTVTQRLLEEGQARPEDAAMRAGTDVKIQAEIGEREAARELMSMGVDPSAGRFGALSRRSAIQTAGEQAKAMNAARIAERNRATQVNLATASQLKPEQLATTAANLRGEGTKMLTATADLARTGADIIGRQQAIDLQRLQGITQIGSAYGNLASQYASAVSQPYGELAGYFLGKAGGAINPAGITNSMAPAPTTTRTAAVTTPTATSRTPVGNASRSIALGQSTAGSGGTSSQQSRYLWGIDTAEPKYN